MYEIKCQIEVPEMNQKIVEETSEYEEKEWSIEMALSSKWRTHYWVKYIYGWDIWKITSIDPCVVTKNKRVGIKSRKILLMKIWIVLYCILQNKLVGIKEYFTDASTTDYAPI